MAKEDDRTHLTECLTKADPEILAQVDALLQQSLLAEMRQRLASVIGHAAEGREHARTRAEQYDQQNAIPFALGLLARFLLSCLLDADRINSAEFGGPPYAALRAAQAPPDWPLLRDRLEQCLTGKPRSSEIDRLRASIADACAARGASPQGIFSLTVPTGGGKTLSSLRFALAHAREHALDRIIYVLPYTSIIEQNAAVAREVLETKDAPDSVVLEHHSNIQLERETWQGKLLAANWDCPVVFTTMVQFLEALFGSGTRSARRMHSLARSVLIFDEIQTLPLPCMHLFCRALNFLVHDCGSSAVLCTATQPLLGNLPFPFRGQLTLAPDAEIAPDVTALFTDLRRVRFRNHCASPMELRDIVELARTELRLSGSCLIVTNTKGWAERLYHACAETGEAAVFLLSTHLCPAHRAAALKDMKEKLDEKMPVICVSTQLIECGVDISFGSVIRFAAGLDSILQAAGRCNRHGERPFGVVHIVAVPEGTEPLSFLPDIAIGRRAFLRLTHEKDLAAQSPDIILDHPEVIRRYFAYYFHEQAGKMVYPLAGNQSSLLRMLGLNDANPGFADAARLLQQSFAHAAFCFNPIDAPTQGILVPYGRGSEIIAELASASGLYRKRQLLREAQHYTVNAYANTYKALCAAGAVRELAESGVLCLRESWYSDVAGVCTEPVGTASVHVL